MPSFYLRKLPVLSLPFVSLFHDDVILQSIVIMRLIIFVDWTYWRHTANIQVKGGASLSAHSAEYGMPS